MNSIKKHSLRFVLIGMSAIGLGGCGIFENSTTFDPVALTQYPETVHGQIAWTTQIGSGSDYGFSPQIVGNSVFAATPNGHVAKVNLANGHTDWNISLKNKISGGVGANNQLVVVSLDNGKIQALNAQTGKEVWNTTASSAVSMPPLLYDGLVIVKTDDYRIQAFDQANGNLVWSFYRSSPTMSLQSTPRMVATNAGVITALPNGRIAMLTFKTGQPVWELVASAINGGTELDTVNNIVGQPLVHGNTLCTASYQKALSCFEFNKQGIRMKWSQPVSSSFGPIAEGSSLYATSIHGALSAFNIQTGQELWKNQILKNRGLTNPVYLNSSIAVGDYQGYIHFFNSANGAIEGRISTGSSHPILSPLTITPYGILVQNGAGHLVMVNIK